jgi:hypothetical protein
MSESLFIKTEFTDAASLMPETVIFLGNGAILEGNNPLQSAIDDYIREGTFPPNVHHKFLATSYPEKYVAVMSSYYRFGKSALERELEGRSLRKLREAIGFMEDVNELRKIVSRNYSKKLSFYLSNHFQSSWSRRWWDHMAS